MNRYSIIENKNPREIVLLRGSGCKWKKCIYCDYHLDFCKDEEENFRLNSEVLQNVTGVYKKLEVINSGSFAELDKKTLDLTEKICLEKGIKTLYFESHYIYKNKSIQAKKYFAEKGITLKIKTGVETFDKEYREHYLNKGFGFAEVKEIAEFADEICLLFGINGQTEESMQRDIETGLENFERVCINIMNKNSTAVEPDTNVIKIFTDKIAPIYRDNDRVDILMDNLEFGIGTKVQEVFLK